MTTIDIVNACVFMLEKNFETDIQWTGKFHRPLEAYGNPDTFNDNNVDYLLDDSNRVILGYVSEIHGWLPANPSKNETVESLNEIYIHDKIDKFKKFTTSKEENEYFVNDYNMEKACYNLQLAIEQNDYIYVIGKKGVGKTTFMNWWLNNNSTLLASRNIHWFRVDASKIYQIWNSYEDINCSLFTYHRIHVVYVVLKYSQNGEDFDQNIFFKKIVDDIIIEDSYSREYISIIISKINSLRKNDQQTEQFFNLVLENEFSPIGKISSLKDICIKIYNKIEAFFLKNDLTMLFIVDGVDNISWVRSRKNYNKLLSDIIRYFGDELQVPIRCKLKRIVTLRNETIADIDFLRTNDSHVQHADLYEKYEVRPPRISKLMAHKADIATSPKSKRFSVKQKNVREKIKESNIKDHDAFLESNIKEFEIYSKNYAQSINNSIKSRYKKTNSFIRKNKLECKLNLPLSKFDNPDNLLMILYNYNVRAFVNNAIENFKTIKFAQKQNVVGASNQSRLPIYLLTNGRLFLNTPHQIKRLKGNSFPNIFWWNEKLTLNKPFFWHGLCSLRILQLAKKNRIDSVTLKKIIKHIFGYDKIIIKTSYERCIQYGLLTPTIIEIDDDNLNTTTNKYIIELTDKGKFLLDYIFIYPDWLYICSLDTPLDESCVANSKQISIHRDFELNPIQNYLKSFTITLPTFVRHIYTQHNSELKKIANNSSIFIVGNDNNEIQIFKNIDDAQQTFVIPAYFKYFITKTIRIVLYRLYNNPKSRLTYEELIKDLLGEYQKSNYIQ